MLRLQPTTPTASADFKLLLAQGVDEIAQLWLKDVRADYAFASTDGRQEPLLLDSLPQVLDEILRVVELDESKIAREKISSAARHGYERARLYFDVRELVRECQILREHIFLFLQEHQQQFAEHDRDKMLSIYQRVGHAIDEATRETINAFIEEHTDTLRHLSRTDGLTGLYNHRTFYERLDEELQRARRYKSVLSIVFIDLDNFKIVNDTLGHQFGDNLLAQCAKWLRHELRQSDNVYRYGGDEFSVVLPETNLADAQTMMERLTGDFRKFARQKGAPPSFGMSFGLASYPDDDGTVTHLVEAADERLRLYKREHKLGKGIIRGSYMTHEIDVT